MARSSAYPTFLRLVGAVVAVAFPGYGTAIGLALNVAASDRERRYANRQASRAFEESLRDREIVVRGADVPGDIAYGRVGKVGGVLVYAESTGPLLEDVQVCVALSPIHEIDAIERIFIQDKEVGTLDVNGWVTDGHFARTTPTPSTHQIISSGANPQTTTLPLVPTAGAPLTCFWTSTPTTENQGNVPVPVISVVGQLVTLDTTGIPPGSTLLITYTGNVFQSFLRVRKYLGTPTDPADAALIAASGGRWTVEHRGRGRPHIVITGTYDEAVWGSIDPTQISAVIRGKKVLDPRTGITAWSRNAVLQQRDYLVDALGFKIASANVPTADVITGANISDETITVDTATLGAEQLNWERRLTAAVEHGLWTRIGGSGGAFTFEDQYSGTTPAGYTTLGTGAVSSINSGEFNLRTTNLNVGVVRFDNVPSHAGARIEVDMYVPFLDDNTGNSSVIFCSTYWGAPTAQSYGYEFQLRKAQAVLAKGSNTPAVPFAEIKQSAAHGVGVGQKARVEIEYRDETTPVAGKRIVVRVNGVERINFLDSVSPWTTGQAGYRAFHGAGGFVDWRYDNLRVVGFVTAGVYTQPRYCGDGILSTTANRLQNLMALLSASAGFTTFSQGLCRIFAGAYRTPLTPALTDDDLTGVEPIETQGAAAFKDLFNAVRGTHFSPVDNWQRTDFPQVKNATYEAEDGELLEIDMPLPMTADSIAAQRLALIALEESRQALVQSAAYNLAAYLRTPGDTILRISPRYGWPNPGKAFRVLDRRFSTQGVVGLVLKEESPFIWDWTPGQATSRDPAPNTLLPNPNVAAPISGLALTSTGQFVVSADGTVTSRILATWTPPADANVTRGGFVDVEYRRADLPDWLTVATLPGDASRAFVAPVSEGAYYFVRARTRNPLNVRSDWVMAGPHQVASKTTLGVAPAGLTLTLIGATTRRFAWSMASYPASMQNFELRYQAGNVITWASATKLATIAADRSQSLTWIFETDLPGAGTWSFEIRSVDSLGNYSATGAQLLNQTIVAAGIPPDGSITIPKIGAPFESLCPDPYFSDVAWWTTQAHQQPGFVFEDSNGSTNQAALLGVRRAAVLASPAFTGTGAAFVVSGVLPYSAVGQKLRLRARANNAANSDCGVVVRFENFTRLTVLQDSFMTFPAGSGIQTRSQLITVPPGTSFMSFYLFRDGSGGAFAGAFSISEVKLDVAAESDLIPPGTVIETVEEAIADATAGGAYASVIDETSFWSGGANPIKSITVTPSVDCEAEAIITGNIRRTNTSAAPINRSSGTLIKLASESLASPIPRQWVNSVEFQQIPAAGQMEIGFAHTRRELLTAGVSYTFQAYLRKESASTALGTAQMFGGKFRVRLYKR